MEDIKSPHDLLPIVRPLETTVYPDNTFFYENVVKKLIPDIIQMEANGIPINLDKVNELEKVVTNVLDEARNKLANNDMMLDFLKYTEDKFKKDKTIELEAKKKDTSDFLKSFNIKNTIHRTFVVNHHLDKHNKSDMKIDKWSIKDLKKLNQILVSKFISDLLDNNIQEYMKPEIEEAMIKLAETKADIFNKNKIETKIEDLQNKNLIDNFNPASSLQIQNFFEYYNIKSENKTKGGNPQWDRAELERLQKLLNLLIKEEE